MSKPAEGRSLWYLLSDGMSKTETGPYATKLTARDVGMIVGKCFDGAKEWTRVEPGAVAVPVAARKSRGTMFDNGEAA